MVKDRTALVLGDKVSFLNVLDKVNKIETLLGVGEINILMGIVLVGYYRVNVAI